MTSPWVFWLMASLCVGLIAALGLCLQKLYELRNEASRGGPAPPAGPSAPSRGKVEELLNILLALQEHSLSQSSASPKEDFARAVVEGASRLTGAPAAALMAFDEQSKDLKPLFARGLEAAPSAAPDGPVGRAYRTGQTVSVPQEPSGRTVAVPLVAHGKSIGVLALFGAGESDPAADGGDKFLGLFSVAATSMLQNLDLVDNLQDFYLEMVQTLARAVDSKDAYTHEHSDRAKNKARRLAQELKLPAPMVRYVEYAALLHDIGKIGIDEAILLKPGKLTPEEYEVMKRHPMIGHQILSPVKFLGPVAQMVLYHQEWYNGQGYPEALKGEEIPLGARIVAVIDAWDAMTSDRPYRKALGREKAISELRRGAGTQFDPHIIEVFLDLEEREWRHDPGNAQPR